MNSVCAVVVTYKRLSLLKESIEALRSQDYACDILVIDNHSSDGTDAYLDENRIDHVSLKDNIGGAGGFNVGIKRAVQKGYEYVWIMDDDCIPNPDALKKLIIIAEKKVHQFGFLASKVIWTNGDLHHMNKINYKEDDRIEDGLYRIDQATFVSLLLDSDVIKKVGLPIMEFFIWGDDIEYTRRIAKRNKIPSYYVENSVVVHKTKTNVGSKIAYDEFEKLKRYRYAYRNEFYLYRQEGIKGITYYVLKCIYNIMRIIVFSRDHKKERLSVLIAGIKEGIRFDPEVEFI